jgi:hypothetical protein
MRAPGAGAAASSRRESGGARAPVHPLRRIAPALLVPALLLADGGGLWAQSSGAGAPQQAPPQTVQATARQALRDWQEELAEQRTQSLQLNDYGEQADVAGERQRLRDGLVSDAQLLDTVANAISRATPGQVSAVLQDVSDDLVRQAERAERDASHTQDVMASATSSRNAMRQGMASANSAGDNSAADALKGKDDALRALADAESARARRLREAAAQLLRISLRGRQ